MLNSPHKQLCSMHFNEEHWWCDPLTLDHQVKKEPSTLLIFATYRFTFMQVSYCTESSTTKSIYTTIPLL